MGNTTQASGAPPAAAGAAHGATYPHMLRGIITLVINGCFSGISTCINEWLIKFQDPRAPLMFKNLQIYIYGALVCSVGWRPSDTRALLHPLPIAIVLTNALAGLCVSAVLKYAEALLTTHLDGTSSPYSPWCHVPRPPHLTHRPRVVVSGTATPS